ncbi:MAG: right-handed parallel beta-helix repeat-containing protein [Nitrososphaeraceae archaeon]
MKSQQLVLSFSIVILTIFSITMLLSQPKNILAAENSCISYNSIENEISIACQHAEFIDIKNSLQDQSILQRESSNFNEKNWILNAGISVEKNATLNIESDDVTWLKIVPSENTPNPIKVDGSLKVDSIKITSWNPQTNDYVYFSDAVKYDELQYTKELRPYIKVNSGATGPTIIQNSELAYLGYKCSGCGGLTFHGGEFSMLINNDIHHIYKGFYSKGMGYMLIEGNRVYNNDKYGIDPHTGTHHMLILNNTVHDNGSSGIICSLDCYKILIEGNEIYNNGEMGPGRGIAFSINMYDSVARNNYVHHQNKCIGVSGGSHDNVVHNNIVTDCEVGIYTSQQSSNNNIYQNTVMNTINGIVVKTGASDNTFHSNEIVNATEFGILNVKDPGTVGNTFENNKMNVQ